MKGEHGRRADLPGPVKVTASWSTIAKHIMKPADFFDYVSISIIGLVAGVSVGTVGGLSLGWLLVLGHHTHGPSRIDDAPVYVAIGLTMLGACLGAIVGMVLGIIYSVRLARQKALGQHVA
jgi:ABC-type nitrate/sulfonate/bicarbonate transport system permease component